MPRILILSSARSGSTYLANLLSNHPKIILAAELLNDEEDLNNLNPLEFIDSELSKLPKKEFTGFKVFCSQLLDAKLRLDDLINYLGFTSVIVLWRKNYLETLTSLRIAETTGEWYSHKESTKINKISLDPNDVLSFSLDSKSSWAQMAGQVPLNIQPIFSCYEDLLENPGLELNKILAAISCEEIGDQLKSFSKRQNPAELSEKIENWGEISALPQIDIDVPRIFAENRNVSLLADDLRPDQEPLMPLGGWRYRVAEPFMPLALKQNVMDAIDGESVSSVGYWPKQMASKLKQLFGLPVAQPCCNGFTSLFLALQTANIGPGHEVILPAFTMVAVSNAVIFLGAKPVFVDSASDNYNPTLAEIKNAGTEKTKAVIVTHTYGIPTPDLELILEECERKGWILIEDISECVGVQYNGKYLGTYGHFACASMYANKMIHAGDGGFVLAKDPSTSDRLTSLVNHGFTPYFHFIHFEPAINAKINGVGAAMACGCIDNIQFVMEHRTQLAKTYRKLLSSLDVKLMSKCGDNDTPWVFGLECKSKSERKEIRAFLAKYGIETRDYFYPLHLQPANQIEGLESAQLPNSEKFGSTGFYLPTHTNLKENDIEYICYVLSEYFKSGNPVINPPSKTPKEALQIQPGTFSPVIRNFEENGKPGYNKRENGLIHAFKLNFDAQSCLLHEDWWRKQMFLEDFDYCLKNSTNQNFTQTLKQQFTVYAEYFKSQLGFDPSVTQPWLNVDLNTPEFSPRLKIPTTTDNETLQLLVWLVQTQRPQVIWEFGCWLGHATALMAKAGVESPVPQKIFACDGFCWQWWMGSYVEDLDSVFRVGNSFLNRFRENTKEYRDRIEAVRLPYEMQELPNTLLAEEAKPDLIYLDISRESDELEGIWKMISPRFTSGKTILVFNGLCSTSLPFLTNHASELVPIAKPKTIAKAYRFVSKGAVEGESTTAEVVPKFKFISSPEWNHHHQNAFGAAMEYIYENLHDEKANTIFVPSVESTICDSPKLLMGSDNWVGIIHAIHDYPELYYTPDLRRMCEGKYEQIFKRCKGLYTLTNFQAKYLRENLKMKIPIQPLFYPMIASNGKSETRVLNLWEYGKTIEFVFIGNYCRDYELFYEAKIPSNCKKVILIGDENASIDGIPEDVQILNRLDDKDYEDLLQRSVVALFLKQEGAANTIILECIARNVPIVAPAWSSCIDYLGEGYPLYYNPENPEFNQLLTLENVKGAIKYLENLDKTKFTLPKFLESIQQSAIFKSIPPISTFDTFDVTISICSYKRVHNIKRILESLWNSQDFIGRMQIIIWNNNSSRSAYISRICAPYLKRSSSERSLELIDSSENYYCSIRFALASLMKSPRLLICDDDIFPSESFISFFMDANKKYPNDLLCVRGHKFLPHKMEEANPFNPWETYETLRFISDEKPEDFIHFAHADTCLIPREILQECASMQMPDPTFKLVDDYWMSFVSSFYFKRQIRKLSTKGLKLLPFARSEDSDTPGLALHTRPEVKSARIRLYIHHMVQGWPERKQESIGTEEKSLQSKKHFWDKATIGFNISSKMDRVDIQDLVAKGVKCVRIGAVGIGEDEWDYDFKAFNTNLEEELERVEGLCKDLGNSGISVVLTLERRVASPLIWRIIANRLAPLANVVGYDLINEPYLARELNMHWTELENYAENGLPVELAAYIEMIQEIRKVDEFTPIILEPSFWAHVDALRFFPIRKIPDDNLIISFHFYEPQLYTRRMWNKKGDLTYPGNVRKFAKCDSDLKYWDKETIESKFKWATNWAQERGVKIILGEFGVSRELPGAQEYMSDLIDICNRLNMSGFVFSWRDEKWDSMNYELGVNAKNYIPVGDNGEENVLWNTVLKGIYQVNERNGNIIRN